MDSDNSTETAIEVCHSANYLVSVCSGIFGAVGIPGNIFVLKLILNKFRTRKCYEWLMFNFAFINLVLCTNGLVLQPIFILDFQGLGCQVAGFINHFFGIVSFCIPPLISLNQYVALYHQDACIQLFTQRNVIFMCSASWLLALAMSMPFLVTDNLGLDETGLCEVQITSSDAEYLIICGFHTPVLISHIITIYCTYKFVKKIRQHRRNVGTLFTSPVTKESRQVAKAVQLFLLVPLFCQIPGLITKTIQLSIAVNPWVSRSMISPFFLASAMYPYLTLYTVKEYRLQTVKLIYCKFGSVDIETNNNLSKSKSKGY